MTFKFKEIKTLKSQLDRVISIMLRYYEVDNVEALHEPRRSELLMLDAVFVEISTLIEELPKPVPKKLTPSDIPSPIINPGGSTLSSTTQKKEYLSMFYGAMLVARTHANDPKSKLATGLNDIIGLGPDAPTDAEVASFHVAFNKFIQKYLFENGDSRLGLKKEHPFSAVKREVLFELLNTNSELERDAQNAVIQSLVADGKNLKNKIYNQKTPISALQAFMKRAKKENETCWTKLCQALETVFVDECSDKGVASINLLDKVRAPQLQFLETLKDMLNVSKLDDQEKTAVLAGGMYLVLQEIISSYHLMTPGGVVHDSLKTILDVDDAAYQDIESLLQATDHFLRNHTIVMVAIKEEANDKTETNDKTEVKDKPKEPVQSFRKAIYADHSFTKIPEFNLKHYLTVLQNMICDKRIAVSNEINTALKEEQKLTNHAGSWSNSLKRVPLIGMFHKKTPLSSKKSVSDVPDNEEENKNIFVLNISPEETNDDNLISSTIYN
jgi:hypothetical protein